MIVKYLSGIVLLASLGLTSLQAQDTSINWLSFEVLDDSLALQPKKVFIDFYTDWCSYCRKMDRVVFTQPEVVALLNEEYYAVRFDAETEAAITFDGHEFVNDQIGQSRRPLHQVAQLLALREGQFVAPTLVVLDEDFRVIARYFTYLNAEAIMKVLR